MVQSPCGLSSSSWMSLAFGPSFFLLLFSHFVYSILSRQIQYLLDFMSYLSRAIAVIERVDTNTLEIYVSYYFWVQNEGSNILKTLSIYPCTSRMTCSIYRSMAIIVIRPITWKGKTYNIKTTYISNQCVLRYISLHLCFNITDMILPDLYNRSLDYTRKYCKDSVFQWK